MSDPDKISGTQLTEGKDGAQDGPDKCHNTNNGSQTNNNNALNNSFSKSEPDSNQKNQTADGEENKEGELTSSPSKQKQHHGNLAKRSKFHNLTKLFFNSLLVIFSKENLDKINIPDILKIEIMKVIHTIKNSGKKLNNNVHKTDLFNHSHYNALFLKITPSNIKKVSKNEKDALIHLKCYNFDLKEKQINQKKLEFMNLLKMVNYEIVRLFFTKLENEQIGEQGQKCSTVKNQYMDRVMVSLSKMIEGEYVMRF